MKILVTGASGLVGHHVVESAIRRGHTVYAQHNRQNLRTRENVVTTQTALTDIETFGSYVLDVFPDAIINAAAISNPADVDAEPELSRVINVELPKRLAAIANHISAKFIHFSTDMVFDGMRGNYQSSDTPAPTTLYGQHKLSAEEQVLESGGYSACVLRIPIQSGNSHSERRSLHEKLFEIWAKGNTAKLFTDELRQPCSADNTADVAIELCERNDLHGIFHWAGDTAITRWEMGQKILAHFGLPEHLIVADSIAEHPEWNARPRDLTMNTHPLKGKLKTQTQTFAEQLEGFVIPRPYRAWYHSL